MKKNHVDAVILFVIFAKKKKKAYAGYGKKRVNSHYYSSPVVPTLRVGGTTCIRVLGRLGRDSEGKGSGRGHN